MQFEIFARIKIGKETLPVLSRRDIGGEIFARKRRPKKI
jgi:hypothetical protein